MAPTVEQVRALLQQAERSMVFRMGLSSAYNVGELLLIHDGQLASVHQVDHPDPKLSSVQLRRFSPEAVAEVGRHISGWRLFPLWLQPKEIVIIQRATPPELGWVEVPPSEEEVGMSVFLLMAPFGVLHSYADDNHDFWKAVGWKAFRMITDGIRPPTRSAS